MQPGDDSALSREARWACPGCGASGPAGARFCSQCGERRSHQGLAAQALRRWLATLQALVLRPGALWRSHEAGDRVRWIAPLTLFLSLNMVFFVVASASGVRVLSLKLEHHLGTQSYAAMAGAIVDQRLAATGLSRASFADRFEARQEPLARAAVILMTPALALLVWPLMPAGRRRVAGAWIFSLQLYAFLLVFITAFGLAWLGLRPWADRLGVPAAVQDDGVWLLLASVIFGHLWLALRTAFGFGWLRAALVAACVTVATGPLLFAYRWAVFVVTAWSTH